MSWQAPAGQAESARAKRRAFPIHFYTGRNGSGKTLTAVWDTLPTLDGTGLGLGGRPRPVLSTVRLLDFRDPRPCEGWETIVTGYGFNDAGDRRPILERDDCRDVMHGRGDHRQAHPFYVGFNNWRQLLDWSFGDVVMDEVTGVADSDEGAAMPSAVRNKLPQLRRDDIPLRLTGLSWIRAHKRIREACQAVTRCQSSRPVSRKDPFGADRVYRPRRLVLQATYDAQSLPTDDHTAHAYEQADRLVRGRMWVPECVATGAYDTFAPVLTVGTVSETGRCAYCGGTRRAPECDCPDYWRHGRADTRARSSSVSAVIEAGGVPSAGPRGKRQPVQVGSVTNSREQGA